MEQSEPDDGIAPDMREFLLGKEVAERVVSKDGSFSIEAGETVTEEVLVAANAADALLMLVMSVNE